MSELQIVTLYYRCDFQTFVPESQTIIACSRYDQHSLSCPFPSYDPVVYIKYKVLSIKYNWSSIHEKNEMSDESLVVFCCKYKIHKTTGLFQRLYTLSSGLIDGKLFVYVLHLMNDIWLKNIWTIWKLTNKSIKLHLLCITCFLVKYVASNLLPVMLFDIVFVWQCITFME